jgi:hypothetical protein
MFEYRVKIGRRKYLWGGARIEASLSSSLILHLRVDDEGEPIVVGVNRISPRREIRIGELRVGECFSIPLDGISGVFAECIVDTFGEFAESPIDTFVRCFIATSDINESKPSMVGLPGLESD